MSRNLEKYLEDFDSLPFEPIQAGYRRRSFLENIKHLPELTNVLEVGCGISSIFEAIQFEKNVVVEPIPEFLTRLAKRIECGNIEMVNSTVEEYETGLRFDLVVASCVLHEIEDPQRFLQHLHDLLKIDGRVYVDVPNARSLHRLLAVSEGFLADIYSPTSTQLHMQQRPMVFDKKLLRETLTSGGFEVELVGGHFLKPFHHAKMQELVDRKILSNSELDRFYVTAKDIQDFESEIFAICKKVKR